MATTRNNVSLQSLIEEVVVDFNRLYEEGIQTKAGLCFARVIGLKGDEMVGTKPQLGTNLEPQPDMPLLLSLKDRPSDALYECPRRCTLAWHCLQQQSVESITQNDVAERLYNSPHQI